MKEAGCELANSARQCLSQEPSKFTTTMRPHRRDLFSSVIKGPDIFSLEIIYYASRA